METRPHRQSQSQRPPYPLTSRQSAPTSPAFQSSSSSSSSISSINTAVAQQSSDMPPGVVSAPLPSPSSSQPMSYFGSLAQQAPSSQASQQQQQQQQRIPQGQNVSGAYLGQRGDGSGAPETAPYLKDFSLLAEAAKRAQMACLTRDLGDVGL